MGAERGAPVAQLAADRGNARAQGRDRRPRRFGRGSSARPTAPRSGRSWPTPSRNTHRHGRRYLLRRLLRCGQCGEYLHSRPREEASAATCARKDPASPVRPLLHQRRRGRDVDGRGVLPTARHARARRRAGGGERRRSRGGALAGGGRPGAGAAGRTRRRLRRRGRSRWASTASLAGRSRSAAPPPASSSRRRPGSTVLDGWVGNSAELREALGRPRHDPPARDHLRRLGSRRGRPCPSRLQPLRLVALGTALAALSRRLAQQLRHLRNDAPVGHLDRHALLRARPLDPRLARAPASSSGRPLRPAGRAGHANPPSATSHT